MERDPFIPDDPIMPRMEVFPVNPIKRAGKAVLHFLTQQYPIYEAQHGGASPELDGYLDD